MFWRGYIERCVKPPAFAGRVVSRMVLVLILVCPASAFCAVEERESPAPLPETIGPQGEALEQAFDLAVQALNARSFTEKTMAVEQLGAINHPRTVVLLDAFLNGNLYFSKEMKRMVVVAKRDDGDFDTWDAVSNSDAGIGGRRAVQKVSVNNQLRGTLRGLIAGLQLADPDPGARIAAIAAITEVGGDGMKDLLAGRQALETHPDVVEEILSAMVVFDLDSADPTVRLAAVTASSTRLSSQVRQKLNAISTDEAETTQMRDAALASLAAIETRISRYQIVETVFFGLSLGSILVLAAIGLSITFGVMGVINMAHGELMMVGAYTAYMVQQLLPDAIEYSLLIAVPSAFVIAGLVGILIERTVIQFLYGRPLETLLATFGVSLVLQQAVRSIFSPLNRSVATPEWMSGSLQIVQGLSVTWNRLYILIFAAMVFFALLAVLQRTRLGLEVRAVTQNRDMARAMGINTTRVDVMTFGLGAGIAGVAGVALSQLTNVGPNLGQGYIVDSFMVVVFGGVGNLWGTLVAGLSLGIVNKVLEPAAGAVVAKILVLVFIILFIQKKPRGLFPQKGRAADA